MRTINGYRREELERMARQRRVQLTRQITELKRQLRDTAAKLDKAEAELDELTETERLLEN